VNEGYGGLRIDPTIMKKNILVKGKKKDRASSTQGAW
jgi:hypothetical protein